MNEVKIVENYTAGLRKLSAGVDQILRLAGFDTSTAAVHGLMEVAAQSASAIGCDFEDFMRLAICAWDCHNHRDTACEVTKKADADVAN